MRCHWHRMRENRRLKSRLSLRIRKTELKKVLGRESGAQGGLFDEKNRRSKISSLYINFILFFSGIKLNPVLGCSECQQSDFWYFTRKFVLHLFVFVSKWFFVCFKTIRLFRYRNELNTTCTCWHPKSQLFYNSCNVGSRNKYMRFNSTALMFKIHLIKYSIDCFIQNRFWLWSENAQKMLKKCQNTSEFPRVYCESKASDYKHPTDF
jgi:hypothetical protein